MLGKLAEGYQEFVVDGLGIIADVSDELLDAYLSGAVKRWAGRSFHGVLNLFPIDDRGVTVRRVMRFFGVGVIKLGTQVCDLVVHSEATGPLSLTVT